MKKTNFECCPKFDSKKWDDKEFEWKDKMFIKDKVFTLFYMPVNFGSVISRMSKKIDSAGANVPDFFCLSESVSKWRMDLYLACDKEISDAENVKLSGKYISRVYEGSYNKMSSWIKDFKEFAKKKGHNLEKTYMWYTTCPKCAKKYGKNYVVFVGKIK